MAKYKTYHGRQRYRALRAILILLPCAVVVWFCAFILPSHITFDENGNMVVDFNFFSSSSPTPTPTPTSSSTPEETQPNENPTKEEPPLVIITPTPNPNETTATVQTNVNSNVLKGLFVPVSVVLDAEKLSKIPKKLKDGNYNNVVLEIKNENGDILPPEKYEEVLAVFDDNITVTAMLSACVDNKLARESPTTAWAVKHTSGVNMLDRERNRWLSLYKLETRTYIIDLCKELKTAGFDGILLDNLAFPYDCTVSLINYGDTHGKSLNETVNEFITELKTNLPNYPISCVVETAEPEVLVNSGQDINFFKQNFTNLYDYYNADTQSEFLPIFSGEPPQDALEQATKGYIQK